MPTPPRSRPSRLTRTAGQRGVFALLTALMLPIIVGIMIGIVDLGQLYLHSQELENASEAQSLLYSLYMTSSPDNGAQPDFGAAGTVDLTQRSTRWFTASPPDQHDTQTLSWSRTAMDNLSPSVNSMLGPDYAPRSIASYRGQHRPMGTSLFGTQPKDLFFYTGSMVQQYQWLQFTPIRHRIVLVLDYSTTMQQTFPNNPSLRAIQVLKQAVNMVLDGTDPMLRPVLTQRISWGAVLFAEKTLGTVPLVDLPPHPYVPTPGYDSMSNQGVRQQIQAMVNTQRAGLPYGQVDTQNQFGATNLSNGIEEGIKMLQTNDKTGSAFAQKYLKGTGTLLVVTDGEPSFQATGMYDIPSYQPRVQFARKAALASAQKAMGLGYRILTITTETGVLGNAGDQYDFMKSITGSTATGASYAPWAGEANDTAHIPMLLASINPTNHCLAFPQMNVPVGYPGFWVTPPLNIDGTYYPAAHTGDHFFAFTAPMGSANAPNAEGQVRRWQRPDVFSFDPDEDNSPMGFPTAVSAQRFYVYPGDPGQVNQGKNIVELNAAFCIPSMVYRSQGNTAQQPILRARWGHPRIYQQSNTRYAGN